MARRDVSSGAELRQWDQLRQLSEISGGCCEDELVPRPIWASQPETVELEDALEMREHHLDLLAWVTRAAIERGPGPHQRALAAALWPGLGDQCSASSPFAADAYSGQRLKEHELPPAFRETAETREHRIDHDGDHHG